MLPVLEVVAEDAASVVRAWVTVGVEVLDELLKAAREVPSDAANTRESLLQVAIITLPNRPRLRLPVMLVFFVPGPYLLVPRICGSTARDFESRQVDSFPWVLIFLFQPDDENSIWAVS